MVVKVPHAHGRNSSRSIAIIDLRDLSRLLSSSSDSSSEDDTVNRNKAKEGENMEKTYSLEDVACAMHTFHWHNARSPKIIESSYRIAAVQPSWKHRPSWTGLDDNDNQLSIYLAFQSGSCGA